MYSNMSSVPNSYSSMPSSMTASNMAYDVNSRNMSSSPMSYGSMSNSNQNRFIGGGFLGPFVLGGITGGLLAPAFYRPYPAYNPYPYYVPYWR